MNNIDDILNRYFDGTALPEEEITLTNYFRSENILPQHEVYKPLFAAFDKEKQITAPVFEIPAVNENKNQVLSRKLWISAASAAAVILLAVILFPFNNKTNAQPDYLVYINGKQITDQQKAQQYADKMFREAEEIIRTSYQPFVEINAMKTELDADKIFDDLSQKINYIESENQ